MKNQTNSREIAQGNTPEVSEVIHAITEIFNLNGTYKDIEELLWLLTSTAISSENLEGIDRVHCNDLLFLYHGLSKLLKSLESVNKKDKVLSTEIQKEIDYFFSNHGDPSMVDEMFWTLLLGAMSDQLFDNPGSSRINQMYLYRRLTTTLKLLYSISMWAKGEDAYA